MADYYDALKSAVANLKSTARPARFAFYDRARGLILERLQSTDPPMPAAEVRAEMQAFDAAIRQIEKELLPPARPATAAAPAPAAPATPAHTRPEPAVPREDVARVRPERVAAPRERPGGFTVRHGILIGAAALLVIAMAGYLFWPGDERPARSVSRAPAPATRSDSLPVSKPDPPPASKPDPAAAPGENTPYMLRRQLVYYRTVQPPGTIVIAKSQHFLYGVKPNSAALRYTFSMGPDCTELAGLYLVTRKEGEAPSGAGADTRVMHLGDTKCRIRPIDPAGTLGQNLRSPGFQFAAEDFADLFNRTDPDTRVVVTN